jgi:hypothetical protein
VTSSQESPAESNWWGGWQAPDARALTPSRRRAYMFFGRARVQACSKGRRKSVESRQSSLWEKMAEPRCSTITVRGTRAARRASRAHRREALSIRAGARKEEELAESRRAGAQRGGVRKEPQRWSAQRTRRGGARKERIPHCTHQNITHHQSRGRPKPEPSAATPGQVESWADTPGSAEASAAAAGEQANRRAALNHAGCWHRERAARRVPAARERREECTSVVG